MGVIKNKKGHPILNSEDSNAFQTITVTKSADAIDLTNGGANTLPKGYNRALIQVQKDSTQSDTDDLLKFRLDGVAPATVSPTGFILRNRDSVWLASPREIDNFNVINTASADVVIAIQYYMNCDY